MKSHQKQKTISGKRLQERYSAIGVSQTRFASLMKRTQPAVSQWVHDKVRVPAFVVEALKGLEAKAAARKDGKLEEPRARKPRTVKGADKRAKAKKRKVSLMTRKREELRAARLKRIAARKAKAENVKARTARPYRRDRKAKSRKPKVASSPDAAVSEALAAEAQEASAASAA